MKLNDSNLFRQACYVNGDWLTTNVSLPVSNPFDGSPLGTVPKFGRAEAEDAIAKAAAAWPLWRDKTAKERADILRKWYNLILQHVDDLARILTMEQGKPLEEAKTEITGGAAYVEWAAEEGRRAYGEVIPSGRPGMQPITIRQSIGVVAAITPWNFPSSMITRKAAPALAAGCPVIIKPATATPFSAFALAELAAQAGFPAGVFNVITGDSTAIGDAFAKSPTVRALSFTGSTPVGRELMALCAGTVKKLGLELGGNAPYMVFDDADLDRAADLLPGCKFRNNGQTCVCANRILVQDSVHDVFVAKALTRIKQLRLGNGLESGVTTGPLITPKVVKDMEALVQDAVKKGARLLCGGKPSSLGGGFFEPTLLTDVTPGMRVFREEIFGPIAPVTRFHDEEDAVRLANDTEYGLASYLFARDIGRVWRVSSALEYGMVGVNEAGLATGEAPFGGVKESGLGREGGKQGLEEFMECKYILLGDLAKR